MVREFRIEHSIGGQMTENEDTGSNYCHRCRHFYDGGRGMFCMFSKFEGQYTKECQKYEGADEI